MPPTATLVSPPQRATERQPRRGLVLAIILAVQLMVVLDATIVNIALPDIAGALHFTPANLSWVITAYTLAFGGFLLLGARAGDLLGRRRVFIAGIALFTAASFLGGLAPWSGWLLAARALQGVGGALAAPSALALLMTMFRDGQERVRAIGWYTAVSIGGGAIGLILGGLLVQWVSWRWVLFVNVPIGIVVIALARRLLVETPSRNGHFDVRGALTSTVGVTSLAYGFVRAATSGWGDVTTMVAFVVGIALLTSFVLLERRATEPITPAASLRGSQPERILRCATLSHRRHVRHVLLPDTVPSGSASLQPARDRRCLPALHDCAVRDVATQRARVSCSDSAQSRSWWSASRCRRSACCS